MGKEVLTFGDIEIEKNKFYHYKTSVHLRDVDFDKVLVSNKIFFSEKSYKYYSSCLYNDHKVRPMHKMLLKTSAYVKTYDEETKWMYFLIEDDDFLEKYNAIWDKAVADITKEFDNETV